MTDSVDAALQIRSLDGNGNLDLGDRSLVLNQATDGHFTGTVATTGSVTSNAANGFEFGAAGGTQTYGTLNTGSLTVNSGHVVVTDALNTGAIIVNASGTGGSLTTTTNGLTTGNGTALDTYIHLANGEMRLTDGAAVTGNRGILSFSGPGSRLLDKDGVTSILSHLATNTGDMIFRDGASFSSGADVFTNTGDGNVSLYSSTWSGLGQVVNDTSLVGGFTVGSGSVLETERFHQLSGPLTLSGGTIRGSAGGSATSNPAFVMTGGEFSAHGTLSGGSVFSGGVTRIGAFYTPGTLEAAGGVVLDGGSRFQMAFDSENAANHSQLTVSAGETDGTGLLTVTATAALPVQIDLVSNGGAFADFDPAQSRTWTFATTTDGLAGFASDRFLVSPVYVGSGITGNFGLAANGNNVDLVYDPSHAFDTSGGDVTVGTSLAANGRFGGLHKQGANTLTLTAANAFTGNTTLAEGTLALGHDLALGTGALRVEGSGPLTLTGHGGPRTVANSMYLFNHLTLGGSSNLTFTGSLTNAATTNRTVTVTNTGTTTFGDAVLSATSDAYTTTGRTLTVDVAATAGRTTFTGILSDGVIPGGGLTKTGQGTLALSGSNTYTGTTRVNAGTLIVDGSIATSSLTSVRRGATLSGTGTLGRLELAGTLAPGASPGTLTAGDTAWLSGGSYIWEINAANGVAGVHWDFFDVVGTLDLTALTEADPFVISLVSLEPGNTIGLLSDFDASRNYSFSLAAASDEILGFSLTHFLIDSTGFANDLLGGLWSLSQNGNQLDLTFTTAIPEPGTYAALAGLLMLALAVFRRFR